MDLCLCVIICDCFLVLGCLEVCLFVFFSVSLVLVCGAVLQALCQAVVVR